MKYRIEKNTDGTYTVTDKAGTMHEEYDSIQQAARRSAQLLLADCPVRKRCRSRKLEGETTQRHSGSAGGRRY